MAWFVAVLVVAFVMWAVWLVRRDLRVSRGLGTTFTEQAEVVVRMPVAWEGGAAEMAGWVSVAIIEAMKRQGWDGLCATVFRADDGWKMFVDGEGISDVASPLVFSGSGTYSPPAEKETT